MSGPVSTIDAPAERTSGHSEPPCLEISQDREASVGRIQVRRALPRKGRRAVGAWCFADHMGPASVTEGAGLDIGPHPHVGLQTVTWLLDGQVLHRDSLGSEQVIKPGELNLMTAGNGVTHSEEATGAYRGELHGVQLWVAQPGGTRHGDAAFTHHATLPQCDLDLAVGTVLIGEFAGAASPARHDTALVAVDLALRPGESVLPLRADFEYAAVVVQGAIVIDGRPVVPGRLAYLGLGRQELVLQAAEPTRALLLGGEPFEEPIVMWWNFVGRSREELEAAFTDWDTSSERFGRVASRLPRIPTPPPYWMRGSA